MFNLEEIIQSVVDALKLLWQYISGIPHAMYQAVKPIGQWVEGALAAIGHFLVLFILWVAIICGTWIALIIISRLLYLVWQVLICKRRRRHQEGREPLLRTHNLTVPHTTTIIASRPRTQRLARLVDDYYYSSSSRLSRSQRQTGGHHARPGAPPAPPPPRSHRVAHEYHNYHFRHPTMVAETRQLRYQAVLSWLQDPPAFNSPVLEASTPSIFEGVTVAAATQHQHQHPPSYGTIVSMPPPPPYGMVPSLPPPPSYTSQTPPPPYD